MRRALLWFALLLILPSLAAAQPAEPVGCRRPPDDYTQVTLGYATLNARTLFMLDHAQTLYNEWGGSAVDFRLAITQGSYNAGGVAASFGTHDAGGAVDLSVRSRVDWSVLEDDIPLMIRALRVAGFAAWVREADSLYPGSPIHIHAIAVGDADLSPAALGQIEGPEGYLRGFDGLPREDATPVPDPHGGPVICDWMRALGYDDWQEPERNEGDIMGFLRRLLGGGADKPGDSPAPKRSDRPGPGATPGEMLNFLQDQRDAAEQVLLRRYQICPKCESDYLRVGAWASKGRAGWTVTCVNCGLMLEKTVEIGGE